MRALLISISLVCIAIPIQAFAKPKPKIAVAPLAGDSGNKVAQAVADALAGKDFVVVDHKEVGREMKKLGLSGELDTKTARKLTTKLEAVAVIDGKITKFGKKRSLHLEVHRRGKPESGFTIEFKSTSSDGFQRAVHDEIVKKLEGASEDGAGDDDDDKAKQLAAKQAAEDEERKRKLADDDEAAKRARKQAADDAERKRSLADDDDTKRTRKSPPDDDDRKRKRAGDEPAGRKKRVAESDDEPAVRKRKSRKQADDAETAPLVLARVGAGGLVAQRRLTFDTRSGLTPQQAPPRVITTAGAARVDGEIYPIALASPDSALAGLGLAGEYDKTLGLAIKIPNMTLQAPIDQAHYAIGARYRFGVGDSATLALGFDYVRRHYIANRSSLMGVVLDAPDVDYTAVAPGVAARVSVAPTVTLFGGLDGMLIFDTGAIQKSVNYGSATVYGVDVLGGVDIALAKLIGLRIALEYSQINFSFGTKGMMATMRDGDGTTQDVMGAVDRSIGVAATLGLTY